MLRRARLDPLCNSGEWAEAYASSCVDPATIFGWTVESAAEGPVAVLPFRVEPSRGFLRLRRAIHVADGTFDSDYLGFPIVEGFEDEVIALAIAALAGRRDLHAVVLSGAPEDSPTSVALRRVLAQRSLPTRELDVPCLRASLPGGFEEYLGGLRSRMRSKVRSAMRSTRELGARLVWCDDAARLDQDLDGLFLLHGLRWSAAGRTGSFQGEARRRFYRRLASDLLSRGALRFARLDVAGDPVAYQIGAVAGDAYYQLQEGFHPDFADRRVGVALRGMVVHSLIEEGLRHYDFMAGAARHKEDWGGTLRPCRTIAFSLPSLRGRLAFLARRGLERLRSRSSGASSDAGSAGDTDSP